MDLINLQRWYDQKNKSFSFFMEIAYSTGRIKERHLDVNLTGHENLTWNCEAQYFNSNDHDYKEAHEANYVLIRIEDFINKAFEDELQGDIYIDEYVDRLLAFCRQREETFRRFRDCKYTICSALLLPRPVKE